MTDSEEKIKVLIERATTAPTALDAMQFAQAALNAANALCALMNSGLIRKN